jgi:hypothetical protein
MCAVEAEKRVAAGDTGLPCSKACAAAARHQHPQLHDMREKLVSFCECGRASCGSSGGVTCWAWLLDALASGLAAEKPMRSQCGKRSRE